MIFAALCIVICQAAPPAKEGGLKSLLHRQKRHETESGKPDVAPVKPDSVKAREGLQHHSGDHGVAPVKPDSVKAREGLQHNPSHEKKNAEVLIAHHALSGHKQAKRDIPVPTEIKTTAAPKEAEPKEAVAPVEQVAHHSAEGSTTPHGPLRHRPVPVAELFNKAKPGSSEEESKESEESKETKETKA
ncbi:hypothetical protein KR044_002240 [Drosophila immigrans]|nr:hypothetical protein KR044_002240 [Drosophila immigrans]